MTETVKKIAFVGDYLPRQCGIATFTTDLRTALADRFPETECIVVAVNDREEGYDYPEAVKFEIEERNLDDYRRAAEFLNLSNVDLVCVQHEFGIYGGMAGSHLLTLLREVRMPVVTTLHTILREPSREQREVMEQIVQESARVVVMTQKGVDLLREVYAVPEEKVVLIAHGIPDFSPRASEMHKVQFGLDGHTVLLTFGLISPGKGIEHVIDALPSIIEEHPDVIYVVLGATHPNLRKREGEGYRLSLQRRAEARGVAENVRFYDQFVSLKQLLEFIGATDIYITPYLNEEQITSGTLAYAFGAGKAVVSTPYWHAKELLADGRGKLVPFGDGAAIATAVTEYLGDETLLRTTRENAHRLGREMTWPRAAERYLEVFSAPRAELRPLRNVEEIEARRRYVLPPLNLGHVHTLTDGTGILQHAVYTVPRYREGYTTDDNARAFILTHWLGESGGSGTEDLRRHAPRYLAFLWEAFDEGTGLFRNFYGFDRRWLEAPGMSDDAGARALWAMGTAMGRRGENEGFRALAGEVWKRALPVSESFTSPRAWGFVLLAIHEYLRNFSGDAVANELRLVLTARLVDLFERVADDEWRWFETNATYDNAVISHALILSGRWTEDARALEIGLDSLRWLARVQTSEGGCFSPIGSDGFYVRGGERARFDQQPLEAQSMVSACLEAFRVTKDPAWQTEAQRAFEWFLGRNDAGISLYDSSTGGCRDGLHADRANENQGAESTLAFHLALSEMRMASVGIALSEPIDS